MAGVSDINKNVRMNAKKRLAELEIESDRILDELFEKPTDEKLIRRLNEIDVEIVRLSGDKVLDCITL